MTDGKIIYAGGSIFDGLMLHQDRAAQFEGGVLTAILPMDAVPATEQLIDLNGDILSPGYTDLQVNGGGGVLFNDDPSVATLRTIAAAHRELGATTILPTLISDTPEKTEAAIRAVEEACKDRVPGIGGLHLEGPHLSIARKGAHDAAVIRPMSASDLRLLLDAGQRLPTLKITIAPESVSTDQVNALAQAGIIVSLGHTDADFELCIAYAGAGASCVTHLFNAMSQLQSRAPGLVGAALSHGGLSAGLIADGIHVHPAAVRAAFASKADPGRIFLVSDAMAVAGSTLTTFTLSGRKVTRSDKRLTLEDGTLAGADLDLTTAIRFLCDEVDLPLEEALQAATTIPAALIGKGGVLVPRQTEMSNLIRIKRSLTSAQPLVRFDETERVPVADQ